MREAKPAVPSSVGRCALLVPVPVNNRKLADSKEAQPDQAGGKSQPCCGGRKELPGPPASDAGSEETAVAASSPAGAAMLT
eukprot:6184161-Pleurochrysis_carterae.AAC.1